MAALTVEHLKVLMVEPPKGSLSVEPPKGSSLLGEGPQKRVVRLLTRYLTLTI